MKKKKKENADDKEVKEVNDKSIREKVVDNLKGVLSSDLMNGLLTALESHIPNLKTNDNKDVNNKDANAEKQKADN